MGVTLEFAAFDPEKDFIKRSLSVTQTKDDRFIVTLRGTVSMADLRPLLAAAEKQLRLNLAKYQTNPTNRVSRVTFANSEPPSVKGE